MAVLADCRLIEGMDPKKWSLIWEQKKMCVQRFLASVAIVRSLTTSSSAIVIVRQKKNNLDNGTARNLLHPIMSSTRT
jgi:hypothetical protein